MLRYENTTADGYTVDILKDFDEWQTIEAWECLNRQLEVACSDQKAMLNIGDFN